jgi:hypothetical protein
VEYPLISAPDDGLHYKREFEAVERMSKALFQSIDFDELVETTLHIALEEVGAEAGSILLANPEKEDLIFQYSIGDRPVPHSGRHQERDTSRKFETAFSQPRRSAP